MRKQKYIFDNTSEYIVLQFLLLASINIAELIIESSVKTDLHSLPTLNRTVCL